MFSSLFRCRKLALYRINFLHFGCGHLVPFVIGFNTLEPIKTPE